MTWQQVTKGESAQSLTNLSAYEDKVEEGQRMKLEMYLSAVPHSDAISQLNTKLAQAKIPAEVQAQGTSLSILARKGLPWLAIIVAVILGVIVLAILIMSWVLFKEVKEVLPAPVIIIGVIAGIALIAVLTLAVGRKQIVGGI